MGLFQTFISPNLPHGVYAVSVAPPASVSPTGTGHSVEVGQFPWGPLEVYTSPPDIATFWQTFAPAGMTRTGSAHLSTIRKGWPQLSAVRVGDVTSVAATCIIAKTGPTTVMTFTAKYQGTSGNSISVTIGASGDGISGHFSVSVQVSSASGTTTEYYDNCNITGTGADVLPNVSQSVLLASVVKNAAAASGPIAGTTVMSGGTNGTVSATQYVGTPGGNDAGLALLESDDTIDHVFTDDSSSFRATVNAGLVAHGILTTDRVCYMNGDSGQTAAQAQTDVATYTGSINSVYVDPWTNVSDDTDGTIRLIPGSSWAASVASQIPPSASISWRSAAVSGLLAGISSLEFNRGNVRAQNTAAGITTLIKGNQGGFAFEAGVNTSLVSGLTNLTRTRMGIYIARSAVNAWYPFVDAPNIPFYQQDLVNSADSFLSILKGNAKVNPATLPYIVDFLIAPTSASNTAASLAAGGFNVGAAVQIGSNMARISLSLTYGETVVISTT